MNSQLEVLHGGGDAHAAGTTFGTLARFQQAGHYMLWIDADLFTKIILKVLH